MRFIPSVKVHLAGGCASPKICRYQRLEQAAARACMGMAIFACALFTEDFAHGDESRCPDRNVVIHSADRRDAMIACEAAGKAIDFLASHGLDTTGAVEVHLVRTLPDMASKSSAGCYDRVNRRVYMLAFSECLKQGAWFELPLDRALYESFLTHEVAHAVAAANFSIPEPSLRAQEYLAYVTMLATMPPKQRSRVLERFPGEGFDSNDQISTIYYMVNPSRFGVQAYRHFLKPANGEAFLREVLSGRVLIGDDLSY